MTSETYVLACYILWYTGLLGYYFVHRKPEMEMIIGLSVMGIIGAPLFVPLFACYLFFGHLMPTIRKKIQRAIA